MPPLLASLARLAFVLLIWWQGAASATTNIDIAKVDDEPLNVTTSLTYLEDAEKTWGIDEIISPELRQRFEAAPSTQSKLNFGFTQSAYWLRLHIVNSAPDSRAAILDMHYTRLTDLQLYVPTPDGGHRIMKCGLHRPAAEWAYSNRFCVFPVDVAGHGDVVLYLRVEALAAMIVPLQLWARPAFETYEQRDEFIHAAYFGMGLAMGLFNLLLYVSLRDRSYLLYVIFVSSVLLAIAGQTGVGKQWLWTDSVVWANLANNVGYSLGIASLLLLAQRMLSTHERMPRIDRLFRWMAIVYALLPLGFYFFYRQLVAPAALANAAAMSLILFAGLYGCWQRQRSAYFFVLAFAMMCLSAIAIGLQSLNLLWDRMPTTYILQLGSAMDMILLSFALADRFHTERREKLVAQQQMLAAERELVTTLQNSERHLEMRVEQRTAELTASNSALSKANADLARQAITDRLTGMFNRLKLDQSLNSELLRCQRYTGIFSVILLDIDHFKAVNDTHGHLAGDQVLVAVAEVMHAQTREIDIAGRWGGEEFLVLCPNTDSEGARILAEKLRTAIACHDHGDIGHKTASFGVATYRAGDNVSSLVSRADAALYQAKHLGRNRVETAAND
jgi:diguanylate cyclase (GGDEF)-like protein